MSEENTSLSDSSTESQNNSQTNTEFKPWGMELNTFCMLMHLTPIIGGIILLLIMWLTNKEQSEVIDQHGKTIMNASIVYILLSFITCGIFIFPLIIFAILGALEANKGNLYEYPLSIKFIK